MPKWPSRPSARWPDAKEEMEFECLECKDWKPWFSYTRTLSFLFCQKVRLNEYEAWLEFHEDPVASQCHRFACDFCTENAVRDSGAWIVQDASES